MIQQFKCNECGKICLSNEGLVKHKKSYIARPPINYNQCYAGNKLTCEGVELWDSKNMQKSFWSYSSHENPWSSWTEFTKQTRPCTKQLSFPHLHISFAYFKIIFSSTNLKIFENVCILTRAHHQSELLLKNKLSKINLYSSQDMYNVNIPLIDHFEIKIKYKKYDRNFFCVCDLGYIDEQKLW